MSATSASSSARVRYGAGDPGDGLGLTVAAGYSGATGDFRFFDDGGTNLVASDDHTTTRRNNGFDAVDGVVRAGGQRGELGWQLGVRALGKRQGVPGAGWDQAVHTRLDTVGAVVDGAVVIDRPGAVDGLTTRLAIDGLVEAQAFHDPDDEIGLSAQDRRYLTLGLGGQSAWALARGRHRLAAADRWPARWCRRRWRRSTDRCAAARPGPRARSPAGPARRRRRR